MSNDERISECCSREGYRRIFSERSAEALARRYRRRGLDSTSRSIVRALSAGGATGGTLLEVGGGVGAIQVELLRSGFAHATCVELTPTYEDAANALLRERGLEELVDRRVLDFAEEGGSVDAADVVVMNRVVCCYHDMPRLVGAAADHTRAALVMTFPNGRWWTHLGLGLANLVMRVLGCRFKVFVHPPALIRSTAERHGLRATLSERGFIWQVLALSRERSA
jgi:magnesium-protoporphyrin O-methyltransferase